MLSYLSNNILDTINQKNVSLILNHVFDLGGVYESLFNCGC